jgi:hypothetical protein
MSFEDKSDLIADLINSNKFKNYVEVGVYKGDNLKKIIDKCPDLLQIYGVDSYSTLAYSADNLSGCSHEDLKQVKREALAKLGVCSNFVLLNDFSIYAYEEFKPHSLDIVFIDAAHDYESVKGDILIWLSRVKPGGIVCGHDYCDYYPGVKKAVDEVFENDFKLLEHKVWVYKVTL